MYLFTRTLRLNRGRMRDSMTWAAHMTEKVNQVGELQFSLWTTVFSPGLNTLAWVAGAQSLTELESLQDKLMADDGYAALVDEAMAFLSTDPVDDLLMNLIVADPDAAAAQPQYATTVRAVPAMGHVGEGIALGIEAAQLVKQITGAPTSFGAEVAGEFGAVGWVSIFESAEQMERALEALNSNAEYIEMLDKKAGVAYQPGATQTAWRRVI